MISVPMPKPPGKTQQIPKPAVPQPAKEEQPQPSPSDCTASRPIIDLKSTTTTEDDCLFTSKTEIGSEFSTTASRASSSGFNSVGLGLGQNDNRSQLAETINLNLPFREHGLRQPYNGHSNLQGHRSQAAILKRFPASDESQLNRKRASLTPAETRKLEPSRVLQSYHSSNGACGSSTEDLDNIEGDSLIGYRHARPTQRSYHSDHTLSSSIHPLNAKRQPVAFKPINFSGSSSGLAGLPLDHSWQTTNDLWGAQNYKTDLSIWKDGVGPGNLFPTYPSETDTSLGADFTETSLEGVRQMHTWDQPLEMYLFQNQRTVEADVQPKYLQFHSSGLDSLSMRPGHQDDLTVFQPDLSTGTGGKITTLIESCYNC